MVYQSDPSIFSPFGLIPARWKLTRLKDITTKIGSGATPKGGEMAYLKTRHHYALIRSQNVFDRRFNEEGLAFISDSQAIELKNVIVQRGDLLLNITGDGVTFARACLAPTQLLPACVNQHVTIIRSNPDLCVPEYLLAYLTHPDIKGYIESFNAGGSRRAITKGHIESFVIPLPPLDEQRAIGSVLGMMDDKIEVNRRMNATLESMARAVFRQWFVENDDIDKWEVGKVEDVCISIENGGTPKRMEPDYWNNGSIAWFKTGELNDGALIDSEEKISELGLSNSSCHLWNPKTILIALYASPTVGRLGILELPGTANQACSALIAKPEYGYLFLFYFLLLAREELQRVAVGAAQQNINQSVVKNHKIRIPPPELAQKFQKTIEPLYLRQVANLKESRTLGNLRDSLLPKLMRGEVRVKDVEENVT